MLSNRFNFDQEIFMAVKIDIVVFWVMDAQQCSHLEGEGNMML
jgi:hypothetical protein